VPEQYFFVKTEHQIYVTSPEIVKILDKIYIEKIGIPIYTLGHHDQHIPTHHLGNIFGHLASKNVIAITDQQAQDYADKKDLKLTAPHDGFFLLTWQNH
jgi:16S rRNA (cytosine1407-C5)-methyltransferase